MILFKKAQLINNYLQKATATKNPVGFVPTMGALHEGHLSLINKAAELCELVVCSIFINPTQFNNKIDFEKYPVTIEDDILLLEENKTGVLFLPSVSEIYPGGIDELQQFNLGYLENILEGLYRPDHFQGVCNVMHRLLDIIKPGMLFLGAKDYQQTLVLKKMMHTFHADIKVCVENTLRENDGLAMSSRNMRLSIEARKNANAMYKALQLIKQNIKKNNFENLKQDAKDFILKNGFDIIDYIEICDAETLLPVDNMHHPKKLIVVAAAYIDGVRLIDNILL